MKNREERILNNIIVLTWCFGDFYHSGQLSNDIDMSEYKSAIIDLANEFDDRYKGKPKDYEEALVDFGYIRICEDFAIE